MKSPDDFPPAFGWPQRYYFTWQEYRRIGESPVCVDDDAGRRPVSAQKAVVDAIVTATMNRDPTGLLADLEEAGFEIRPKRSMKKTPR